MSSINPDRWVYNTEELIRTRNDANNPPWCGDISNCTNVMKREDMKGLLTKVGATTATSPLSNDLRREVKMSLMLGFQFPKHDK